MAASELLVTIVFSYSSEASSCGAGWVATEQIGPCMLVCCDPGVALVFGLVCEFVLPSRVCVGGGPVRGREGGQVAELIARRHQVEVKVVNVHLRQGRESLEHSLHG